MNYLTEREYNISVGKILAGKALEPDEAQAFIATLSKFESLLDEANSFDIFREWGQSWRTQVNWN